MSTKVLVVPEDPKNNGYILQPVVERILIEAGRSSSRITILPRSRLSGITNAKETIRHDLAASWKWMDLWLFIPDADRTNEDALVALEKEMAGQGVPLICCAAQPEIEAWMLAGHATKLPVHWKEVSGHPHFKEDVFEPFMDQYGLPQLPGLGREKLTRDTLANYPAPKRLCPEIQRLEERVKKHFAIR